MIAFEWISTEDFVCAWAIAPATISLGFILSVDFYFVIFLIQYFISNISFYFSFTHLFYPIFIIFAKFPLHLFHLLFSTYYPSFYPFLFFDIKFNSIIFSVGLIQFSRFLPTFTFNHPSYLFLTPLPVYHLSVSVSFHYLHVETL